MKNDHQLANIRKNILVTLVWISCFMIISIGIQYYWGKYKEQKRIEFIRIELVQEVEANYYLLMQNELNGWRDLVNEVKSYAGNNLLTTMSKEQFSELMQSPIRGLLTTPKFSKFHNSAWDAAKKTNFTNQASFRVISQLSLCYKQQDEIIRDMNQFIGFRDLVMKNYHTDNTVILDQQYNKLKSWLSDLMFLDAKITLVDYHMENALQYLGEELSLDLKKLKEEYMKSVRSQSKEHN